jgi:hypothetical protein
LRDALTVRYQLLAAGCQQAELTLQTQLKNELGVSETGPSPETDNFSAFFSLGLHV